MDRMENALLAIKQERLRQQAEEGWTEEGDDKYKAGEMARAAACYALGTSSSLISRIWPWAQHWWKPTTRKRNLVKAGALIVAELERLNRAEANNTPEALARRLRYFSQTIDSVKFKHDEAQAEPYDGRWKQDLADAALLLEQLS